MHALEFGLVSKSSRMCIRALTVCAYEMHVAVMRQLPSLLLKLSQIHSTVSMAIPLMEFLSSQLFFSCFYVATGGIMVSGSPFVQLSIHEFVRNVCSQTCEHPTFKATELILMQNGASGPHGRA